MIFKKETKKCISICLIIFFIFQKSIPWCVWVFVVVRFDEIPSDVFVLSNRLVFWYSWTNTWKLSIEQMTEFSCGVFFCYIFIHWMNWFMYWFCDNFLVNFFGEGINFWIKDFLIFICCGFFKSEYLKSFCKIFFDQTIWKM